MVTLEDALGALSLKLDEAQGDIKKMKEKGHKGKGIIESKAILSLFKLDSERTKYNDWNSKLKNGLCQRNSGMRKYLKWIETVSDSDFDEDTLNLTFPDIEVSWEELCADLFSVLEAKATGEAFIHQIEIVCRRWSRHRSIQGHPQVVQQHQQHGTCSEKKETHAAQTSQEG